MNTNQKRIDREGTEHAGSRGRARLVRYEDLTEEKRCEGSSDVVAVARSSGSDPPDWSVAALAHNPCIDSEEGRDLQYHLEMRFTHITFEPQL